MLVEAVENIGIKLVSGARYMDDIRIWLHAVRLGWKMVEGSLEFRSAWRKEEMESRMTGLQKTTEIKKQIMNDICGWLTLTMETEDMFGGVLTTLDLEIWVTITNKVVQCQKTLGEPHLTRN